MWSLEMIVWMNQHPEEYLRRHGGCNMTLSRGKQASDAQGPSVQISGTKYSKDSSGNAVVTGIPV